MRPDNTQNGQIRFQMSSQTDAYSVFQCPQTDAYSVPLPKSTTSVDLVPDLPQRLFSISKIWYNAYSVPPDLPQRLFSISRFATTLIRYIQD